MGILDQSFNLPKNPTAAELAAFRSAADLWPTPSPEEIDRLRLYAGAMPDKHLNGVYAILDDTDAGKQQALRKYGIGAVGGLVVGGLVGYLVGRK